MRNHILANKNLSLKEKWGAGKQNQAAQNQMQQKKLTSYSVNITKLMKEMSQDDEKEQANVGLVVNTKAEKEYQLQNRESLVRQDSETKHTSNDVSLNQLNDDQSLLLDVSLLNGTLHIQSEDDHQQQQSTTIHLPKNINNKNLITHQQQPTIPSNQNDTINQNSQQKDKNNQKHQDSSSSDCNSVVSCHSSSENPSSSSQRGGESTIYNQKCKIFESALRKIELDNFVIHSKVDEFILMKEAKSNEKQQQESQMQYHQMIKDQQKEDSREKSSLTGQSQCINTDLKRGNNGKNEISNRKRGEKFLIKQWERDCKTKFGVNNVFNQFNKLLSTSFNRQLIDPNQTKILSYFNQKCEKKPQTIPKSPKSHLKERLQLREDIVQRSVVDSQTGNIQSQQQSVFKAKKLNKNILKGVLGIPPAQERPATTFEEFNLSYKKQKISEKEYINGCSYTPYGNRDGRISVKKVMALNMMTPKTQNKKQINTIINEKTGILQ